MLLCHDSYSFLYSKCHEEFYFWGQFSAFLLDLTEVQKTETRLNTVQVAGQRINEMGLRSDPGIIKEKNGRWGIEMDTAQGGWGVDPGTPVCKRDLRT